MQANSSSASDAELRLLLDAVKDYAIFMLDAAGHIASWNAGAQRINGYTAGEILGKHFSVLYPEDARRAGHPDRELALASELGTYAEEGVRLRKGGEAYFASTVITPLYDDARRLSGYAKVTRDVTEQRRGADRLATSEAMFRALFEQAPDVIIAVNQDGVMVKVNRKTLNTFGYTEEELIGQPIEIMLPERYRHGHVGKRRAYGDHAQSRPMGSGLDLHARRKDGTEFPVDIMLSPVKAANSRVVIGVIRDITERRTTERQLKDKNDRLARSNRELEQFAYVASHDLQEPLRVVASSCQLLGRRLAGKLDADQTEYLGFAIDAAKRMQTLIQDLLAYARVGRVERPPQDVDLGDILRRVVQNLDSQIKDTAAEVRVGPLPKVRGDASQLVQLFQNLVSNALKFRGTAPPVVAVEAEAASGGWRVRVADNGIGIAPEFRDKIFVIFQRLHRRDEYPGTGIGLAICKKIVETHGGAIAVEPTVGAGSTFVMTFPKTGDGGADATQAH